MVVDGMFGRVKGVGIIGLWKQLMEELINKIA